mmetsp:Transcript_30820/g.99370  ORF Transcript_30820/g.99370 Transcript_30820/m.99370 type:complete len:383 (-) Transcript_30820:2022-3170(-)
MAPESRPEDEDESWLVLRLGHAHKFRAQEWVQEEGPGEVVVNGREVLVFRTKGGARLRRRARGDAVLRRVLNACTVARASSRREDLLETVAAVYDVFAAAKVAKLAVRGDDAARAKRHLLDDLPERVDLAQRGHSVVISVELVEAQCFVGLCDAPDAFEKDHREEDLSEENNDDGQGKQTTTGVNNKKKVAVVSRAYYKTEECCRRWPDVRRALGSEGNAVIDVGAAPGGWAQYCLERGCDLVVAVDPAPLDESLVAAFAGSRRLAHLPCRVEDAVDKIRSFDRQFDAVVCDANCHPNQACRALRPLLLEHTRTGGKAPLLKPGTGVLLLTLKQPTTSQKIAARNQDQDLTATLAALGFVDIRIAWLWANSRRERTLVARYV